MLVAVTAYKTSSRWIILEVDSIAMSRDPALLGPLSAFTLHKLSKMVLFDVFKGIP
jgi:hypothetical protein